MIALLSSSFVVLILFVLIVLFLHFVPLGLWVSALAAGVNVGIFTLVGMRLRRVVQRGARHPGRRRCAL